MPDEICKMNAARRQRRDKPCVPVNFQVCDEEIEVDEVLSHEFKVARSRAFFLLVLNDEV